MDLRGGITDKTAMNEAAFLARKLQYGDCIHYLDFAKIPITYLCIKPREEIKLLISVVNMI